MHDQIAAQARVDFCRKIFAMRKAIGTHLGDPFCPTPCLDMLLDLYVAEQEGRRVYLWSLCMAAHVPISSAHRKVSEMEKQELVTREKVRRDRRQIGVQLTPAGRDVVVQLLDAFVSIWKIEPDRNSAGADR